MTRPPSVSVSLARSLGRGLPVLRVLSRVFGKWGKGQQPAVYGERQPPVEQLEDIEDVLARLDANATGWRHTSRRDKAMLLRACADSVREHGKRIVEISTRAKGSYDTGIAEEFLALIPVVTYLNAVADNFDCLERTGACAPPLAVTTRERPQRQAVVDVGPQGLEALALGGFRGELWISPGYEVTQGSAMRYNEEHTEPGVALVLGAGNQYPLALMDVLHVLVVESRVVVCKMNPVNEYVGPLLRMALEPLVSAGFVEFVYGGADVGAKLVDHPLIKSVHLTGSMATYDAVVWKGQDKTGRPPFDKHVSAELGSVTPYIIVPGEWDDVQIEFHAANVVCGMTNNAGHNCLALEVLVTDAAWPQREQFLDAVRRQLDATSKRSAYYPGSEAKFARFEERFPDCENYGQDALPPTARTPGAEPNGKAFPWKLKTNLTPSTCAVDEENWCGVAQEVALDCGNTAEDFFQAAASFVNESCWGTLSCSVLVDDGTQRRHEEAFDAFIADLRYGTIGVNVPSSIGFGISQLSWGAWGDESEDRSIDIGSGNCKVHNSGLYDHVEKSVVYAPSVQWPTPYWHAHHSNAEATAEAALEFFRRRDLSWGKLLALIKTFAMAVQSR